MSRKKKLRLSEETRRALGVLLMHALEWEEAHPASPQPSPNSPTDVFGEGEEENDGDPVPASA